MPHAMQFSLRTVFLGLPVVGIGAYALTHASPITLQLLFTATIFVFLLGLTISCFGKPSARPFAFGFSLFGIGYIIIVALAGDFETREPGSSTPLLTTRALQQLYVPIAQPEGDGVYAQQNPPQHLFRRVGHTVFAWLLATTGGILAQVIAASGARGKMPSQIEDSGQDTHL